MAQQDQKNKKPSIKTAPEEAQVFDLLDKDLKISENINKEIEILKLKSTMTKTKKLSGGLNARFELEEEKISEPEARYIATIHSEKQKERENSQG